MPRRSEFDALAVVSAGARTAVGSTLRETSVALRAGLAPFAEHAFFVDRDGNPVILAQDEELGPQPSVCERMCELLRSAVREVLSSAGTLQSRTVQVFIGLPASRPGVRDDCRSRVCEIVHREVGTAFDITRVDVVEQGHASGLAALHEGAAAMRSCGDDLLLICGVDSYVDPDAIDWLEMNDQLHCERNPWGFVPGEAAAAVMLARAADAARFGACPMASVEGTAVARERALIKTSDVCVGRGLTEAIQGAVSSLHPSARIATLMCDMNGEPYRADELGYARVRMAHLFVDPSFVTPVECCGDVGAASGALFAALATMSGVASGEGHTLLSTSGEDGLRAAVVMSVQSRPEDQVRWV